MVNLQVALLILHSIPLRLKNIHLKADNIFPLEELKSFYDMFRDQVSRIQYSSQLKSDVLVPQNLVSELLPH